MKTYTNHTPGMRGIRTKDGMVWLDPGASEKIDPKDIVGEVPDLGEKGDDPAPANAEASAAEIADLKKQIEERDATIAGLRADLEKATAPKK